MLTANKLKLNKVLLLNFFICLIPLSLIIGNLAININIILICISGLLMYKAQAFNIENKTYKFLIFSFFFYVIIITFINNWSFLETNKLYKDHIFKSIYFIRYLILFFVIYTAIEKKDFNTKFFFISCAFFSLIISVDVLIQFMFKKNIIGYPIIFNKPSSFFKEEHIAGGYIQKFILFFIFLMAIIKNKINKSHLILFLFLIFLVPIILTANRMPSIIFASSLILYLISEKKIKNIFLGFVLIAIIFTVFMNIKLSQRLHYDLKVFFKDSIIIAQSAPKLFLYNEPGSIEKWGSGYIFHFNSGIQIWKENKIFGHGLKSFRIKCKYDNNVTCNTHPHNYFIEIMLDTGIIGIVLIYLIFFKGSLNFLKYYFNEKKINFRLTSILFFILIFFEFFPFRSTGSFFSTFNATFIFLMLPIFLNIKKLQKLN